MGNSDLVDLTVQVHAETEKAIFVSDDGDSDSAVWLPKSQIEIERKKGNIVEVTLPEWLAEEKGLV
jgi:hypothetical protein